MILPIVAYGDPVLKKKAIDIDRNYTGLEELIKNMYETMRHASGVGLAAPQVGKSIRLFVIDSRPMFDEGEEHKGVQQVFINPLVLEESGEPWPYEEGCLSIPGIREDVLRKPKIRLRFFDEKFKEHEKSFDDLTARVIQHEYDHIEGKLFVDHVKPLKKALLQKRLSNISKGHIDVKYKMRFPQK